MKTGAGAIRLGGTGERINEELETPPTIRRRNRTLKIKIKTQPLFTLKPGLWWARRGFNGDESDAGS